MKPVELKQKFIELRAEGRSYRYIAGRLEIAKTTCSKWEKELSAEISKEKHERLAELYRCYKMTKEERIRTLGGILDKINEALEKIDFSQIPPAKLLDFKLKYTEALKGEIVSEQPGVQLDKLEPKAIMAALADLFNRIREGNITADQAQRESQALANLLKAYETTELTEKVDTLKAAVSE